LLLLAIDRVKHFERQHTTVIRPSSARDFYVDDMDGRAVDKSLEVFPGEWD
jgi:hypothetical protein